VISVRRTDVDDIHVAVEVNLSLAIVYPGILFGTVLCGEILAFLETGGSDGLDDVFHFHSVPF
jgi:hypothetical protein